MSPKNQSVPRPLKRAEYGIVCATTSAEKGWRDVRATQLSTVVDAWDRLTRDPQSIDGTCHPLKGDLAVVVRAGKSHDQWQYELKNGARIWFYVEGKTVNLVAVHTAHPNQTK
ncbi:hypothetical protein ESZ53_09890 [Salinibacterium sp. UTAS2018]|nr:hypothetical protein ESZ53_09890 [Salinibacterium sp. UTAS2018]